MTKIGKLLPRSNLPAIGLSAALSFRLSLTRKQATDQLDS
jgi:hypothetical protein